MTDAADDFDALFEEVAAQRNSAQAAPEAPAAAAKASAEEDELEALFDQVSDGRLAEPVQAQPAPTAPAAAAEVHAEGHPAGMYERLGSCVRMLHDSLRELGYDKALSEASAQIGDAQDRLEYVASLTEQAANKVLNTLDEGMPAQDDLSKQAADMATRWDELFAGKLSIEQFKALAGDSRQFAKMVSDATEKEKARLLDIMMAQDFQDITGQLIKKVVVITKTVEGELAQILRDNAPAEMREKLAQKQQAAEAAPQALMQGPSVPTAALDQDNVDDLLAELGF